MTLPPALVALSPGELRSADLRGFESRVARAARAGLRGLVLRERGLTDRELLELAQRVRGAVAWLAVHDRPHLAREARADAVQLGGRSLAPSAVREWLDPMISIGFSSHEGDDPLAWRGADFLLHAPIADTRKPTGLLPGIGFEALARAVRAAQRPVWALGGLAPEHAAAVRASGASGMAVLSGILPRDDVEARVGAYLANWAEVGG